MQPQCSLPPGPCGPPPTPSSQSSFYQLEEKQLFEKFWRGTFKAVATPRPGSVIVASITARRRLTSSETTARQPAKADEGTAMGGALDAGDRNGCVKAKGRKRRRDRSPSFDEELSPRPKGKKKKKKRRKRKRKRSPSYSLSPLRKRKKKKKKTSSRKSKRHRHTSKKTKHSSSSSKRKRKDERKHKKSSRTHSRRRRRYRRSESDGSSYRSPSEDRNHVHGSAGRQAFGALAECGGGLDHADPQRGPEAKSVCKTAPKYRSVLSTAGIPSSEPGGEVSPGKAPRHSHPRDCDSGNDTSSPPSSKAGVCQSSAGDAKRGRCRRCRDDASDSGNSVTSYASLCKPYVEDGLSATPLSGNGRRGQITLGCPAEVVRSPKGSRCSQRRRRRRTPSGRRPRRRSSSSRSRSRSSGSSRYRGRYSRSLSLSSCSSYSRSASYSGSVASSSSRGSFSRRSADRLRDGKRTRGSRATDVKRAHKVGGKRPGRKSYSPMKKRRRDSPSHLEARRITSARKRPVPYFRPSPSSSSRSTSVSSWSSLFTRSRSRSPSPLASISRSRSRSRSRTHSYSSYRSYSRSSSWNSIFGTRSRSRSRASLHKRHKSRR